MVTEENSDKKKTLVLFDVGGVLLELDYGRFYSEAAKLSGHQDAEGFRRKYTESGLEPRYLAGQINKDQFLTELDELVSSSEKLTQQQLVSAYSFCWKDQIAPVVELKRKVSHAGYSVGIFSNIHPLAVKVISGKWPEIFEVFDAGNPTIYSHEVSSIKPAPEMYERINRWDRVIFIDDKEAYLKVGVEDFGWNGILFTPFIDSAEALKALPTHSNSARPDTNFRTADSVSELEEALGFFE